MKARSYECVLVLDPGLDADKTTEQLEKFQEQILGLQGEIRRWDRWGKKRLAYEIQRKQYGYYAAVVFDGEPTVVKPLDRYIRLNQNILRHLIVVLEPRLVPPADPSAQLDAEPEIIKSEQPKEIETDDVDKKEVLTEDKLYVSEQAEVPPEPEEASGDDATSESAEEVS
ncbi:30S ribosomal protein S6 [bacterium]|nr:30S ribosomal protein S6 [bacterium]